ncbi:hypothetical protein FSS13T_27320 [Flavobacterium saliperosum S13]|uniref:Chalcone isomerase domain-containing protein n=2 Tax=Flavobacterium saliperosum TaxID=329186 RepID=A0A1G4WBM8_9FLAO|nr:hypothetical protein [Flavobacterium saliperosum]ESU21158.1 hypothetical protein FSS13T_27320 [Flavobacterium saliperosum S13]SCX19331.1 hypothetical protein SAMN02927925_02791 [Flavobacterium saliperosum]
MRLFIISSFILFFSSISAQENKIDYISFKYDISNIVFSDVEIFIVKSFQQSNYYDVTVKYYKFKDQVEKKLKLSPDEFNKILVQFKNIKNDDLFESFESGLDGATTSIEVGTLFYNSINYSIWGLHKEQTNKGSKEFLKTIQMILKIADIKISDFN